MTSIGFPPPGSCQAVIMANDKEIRATPSTCVLVKLKSTSISSRDQHQQIADGSAQQLAKILLRRY
ncbi:hypothetical protein [Burkholderia cepacia]|uniref:hypothetical protein n=1 Tax=Burkholderia cepacia TaxID=292 RepID=UPI0012D9DE96|nr:hypothetical protein [Burkholderia cepacia]